MSNEELREAFDLMYPRGQKLLIANYFEKQANPDSEAYLISNFGCQMVELLIEERHPLVLDYLP